MGIQEGFRFLTSSDPDEILLLQALVKKTAENVMQMQDNQAIQIANRVGELWNGK